MPTVGRKGKGNHTQSVLFDKPRWKKAAAIRWLRDNNLKTDGFEETTGKLRFRQVDPESNKFRYRNKDIGKGIILVLGFPKGSRSMAGELLELSGSINLQAELSLQAADGDNKPTNFFLTANSGTVPMELDNFFHKVIVDLKGVQFQKSKTPVIMNHNVLLRIGHTVDQKAVLAGQTEIVGKKTIKGPMIAAAGIVSSKSEAAQGFVEDSRGGFPFQVSIGADPQRGRLFKEGETVTVNGKTFKGPIIVAEKTVLKEFSVLVIGADHKTAAKLTARKKSKGVTTMNEFEEYLQSLGFVQEDLTEDQVTNLKAEFDTKKKLEASATKPKPPPLDPKPEIKATGIPGVVGEGEEEDEETKKLEASRTRSADEEERQDGIKASYAQFKEGGLEKVTIEAGQDPVTLLKAKNHAIRAGWSTDQFELYCRRSELPNPPLGEAPAGHVTNREIQATALEVALLRAAGVPSGTNRVTEEKYGVESWYPTEVLEASHGPAYRGIGLHYLMDMNINAANMHYSGGRKSEEFVRTFLRAENQLRAASSSGFSTLAVGNILENVANKALLAAYQAQEVIWSNIFAVRSLTDFKVHSQYRLTTEGGYAKVGPGGELKHGKWSDQKFTLQADTYGMILSLTRQSMINDDLSAFNQIPADLGRLAALAIEFACLELILAAQGSGFFSVANNNLQTGAPSDLDIAGLTLLDQTFLDQVHDDKPILISPDRILVGSQDKVLANELFKQVNTQWTFDSTATSADRRINANPHVGKFQPVVSPILSNTSIKQMDGADFSGPQDANQWYGFVPPNVLAAFAIGFLNGVQTPVIQSTETDFNKLGMQWRSFHDWGVAEQDPKGAVKMAGV